MLLAAGSKLLRAAGGGPCPPGRGPPANSAKAVFLSVLTQRHLRIILGTFGRYRQQPFDTHSVPVCTPNFSSASYYAC